MNHTERRARALRAAVEIYTGGVPLSQHFAHIIAASDAAAGYVLVPREATKEMLDKAWQCMPDYLEDATEWHLGEAWKTMIAAAKEMEG